MGKELTNAVRNQINSSDIHASIVFKINDIDYTEYLLTWNISHSKDFGSVSALFTLANDEGQFGDNGINRIDVGDIVSLSCFFDGDATEFKRFYGKVDQRAMLINGDNKTISLTCLDYISTLQYLDLDLTIEAPKIKIENDTLNPVYLSTDPSSDLYSLAQLYNFSVDSIASNPPPIIVFKNKSNSIEEMQQQGMDIYYDAGQLKLGYAINSRYNYDIVAKSYYHYPIGLYIEDILETILTQSDSYNKFLFGENSAQNVIDNHLTASFYEVEGEKDDYLTPNLTDSNISIRTYLEVDFDPSLGNTLTVTSTKGFPNSGEGKISGDIFQWTSKDDNHLYGVTNLNKHSIYINGSESTKPVVVYENEYESGKVWYLKYSNIIDDLDESNFNLESGITVDYFDKRFGRIILSSSLELTAIVKCITDYNFKTLQATGIELNYIAFRPREINDKFECIKKLFDYCPPNYNIRTEGDNKIWSSFLSQRPIEDYNLTPIIEINHLEDEDLYTRVNLYAKNKEPHNVSLDNGSDFITTTESYLSYADLAELTYEKTDDNWHYYKSTLTGVGKIVLEQNTIDGTVRVEPKLYINAVEVDNKPYQMVAQPVVKSITTQTETIQITKGSGKNQSTQTVVNTYYRYLVKFPHSSLMPTQPIYLYNANGVNSVTIPANSPHVDYAGGIYVVPGSSRNSIIEELSTGTYWVLYSTKSIDVLYDEVKFKINKSILPKPEEASVSASFQYLTALQPIEGIKQAIDGRWDTQVQSIFYAEVPSGYAYAVLDLGSIKTIQAVDLTPGFFKPDNIRKFDIDTRLTIQYSLDGTTFYEIGEKFTNFTFSTSQGTVSFEEADFGLDFRARYFKILVDNVTKIEYDKGVWVIAFTEISIYSDIVIKGESKLIPATYITNNYEPVVGEIPTYHYKLNDNNSNSTIIESTSGIYNGKYGYYSGGWQDVNTSTVSNIGVIDKSIYFSDSHGEQIDLGTLSTNFVRDFSIAGWFYLQDSSYSKRRHLFGIGSPQVRCNIMETTGKIRIILKSSSISYTYYSNYVLPLNTWKHITIKINNTYGKIELYINGAWQEDISIITSDIDIATSHTVIGGYYWAVADQSWKGYIDDVRFYNQLINQSEIDFIYNSGLGREDASYFPDVIYVQSTDEFDNPLNLESGNTCSAYIDDNIFYYTGITEDSFTGVYGLNSNYYDSTITKSIPTDYDVLDYNQLLHKMGDRLYKDIKVEDSYLYSQLELNKLSKAHLEEFIKNHTKKSVRINYAPYLKIGQTVRLNDEDYNGDNDLFFIESITETENGQFDLVIARYE